MMKRRVFSLFLVLALCLGLCPAALGLEETAPAGPAPVVRVDFTAQAAGGFLFAPQFDVEVSGDLAETYGYTDAVSGGVSALDVLVKAHQLAFADDFTPETAETYLTISNNNPTMAFGDTAFSGFVRNGVYPMGSDGMGALVGTQEVLDGDALEFFTYGEYWDDYIVWFSKGDSIVTSLTVKPGVETALTLKGVMYMGGYNYPTAEELHAAGEPVECADLAWVDKATGALTDLETAASAADGAVTFTAPQEEKTYYLTAYMSAAEQEAGSSPIIMTLLPVTVDVNAPDDPAPTPDDPVPTPDDPKDDPDKPAPAYQAVMDAIAAKYAASGVAADAQAPWLAADLASYALAFPGTAHVLTDAQKQAALNVLIPAAVEAAKPGDLAKYIIALRAMGYDARKVTTADGAMVDVVKQLTDLVDAKDKRVSNIYTLPYVLIALRQGEDYATPEQLAWLKETAVSNQAGWQSTEWGTDGATPMILALAPYRGEETVKTAVDAAVAAVKAAQSADDGSIAQNAASTGLAMAALAAVGENPAQVKAPGSEKSLIDGLLTQVNETADGFLPSTNTFSTEQGFRGLVAAALYKSSGAAVQVYDFLPRPMDTPKATGSESGGGSGSGSGSSGSKTVTVRVKVLTHDETACQGRWTYKANSDKYTVVLADTSVTLRAGQTAFDAFALAMEKCGVSYTEDSPGYISEIGGQREQGHNSANSGWQYMMGSSLPTVSCRDYVLNADASMTWFYTDDYTREKGSESWSGGSSTSKPAQKPQDDKPADEPVQEPVKTFADVPADHWAGDAISFVTARKLFEGTGNGDFSPAVPMTRAMLATVLYRLDGEKTAPAAGDLFSDVAQNTWYTDAVAWANRAGVASGTGDGFRPERAITRQELAVMLYRYAKTLGLDKIENSAALQDFRDADAVADWAKEPMTWAVSRGLLNGQGDATLAPGSTATRAEVAVLLQRFVTLLEE